MANKEAVLETLKAQIEALKTMPEGAELGDGMGRKMLERRRARYVSEAEECLKNAQAKDQSWFDPFRENHNFLFNDELMD